MDDYYQQNDRPNPASVLAQLEDDIVFERIPPGARLTENDIVLRFDVTRHFARQTLSELEKLGLVVLGRHKGARVPDLVLEDVDEIFAVREILVRQAALNIALPASPSLINKLKTLNEAHLQFFEDGDVQNVRKADDRFHLALLDACGNPYLLQTIARYMRYRPPVRARAVIDREALAISHRQHELMIELLTGRDNWPLAQLCVDHIQPAKKRYLAMRG